MKYHKALRAKNRVILMSLLIVVALFYGIALVKFIGGEFRPTVVSCAAAPSDFS